MRPYSPWLPTPISKILSSTPGGLPGRPGAAGSLTVASLVLVAALSIYLPSLAPTLSWRNGGSDGGDLAAAVATLGIPHPPGYPTYVLLGRIWSSLPLGGDLAYRLNLLSAVTTALAAGLAAATIVLLIRARRGGIAPLVGGLVGGSVLATAPLTWSQATIAEVYGPGLAALGALSLLLLGWQRPASPRLLALCGLVGGLGLGLLPQLGLAAPGALAVLLARSGWRLFHSSRLVAALAGLGAGLSVFAYLPLRAAAPADYLWGEAATPGGFWELISAALYRQYFVQLSPEQRLVRLGDSISLLSEQLGPLGVLLVPFGIVALWREQRAGLAYLLGLVMLTIAFRTSYLAEGNAVYLLPAVFGLVILVGLGAALVLALAGGVAGRPGVGLAALVLLAALGGRATSLAPLLDASQDHRAEQFGRQTLEALPFAALVVSERDETTFSLVYQQSLGRRPDVVVVDSRLLLHRWYQRQLVRRYPELDPRAVRPGGLTALQRPVYQLVGPPGEEVARPAVRQSGRQRHSRSTRPGSTAPVSITH